MCFVTFVKRQLDLLSSVHHICCYHVQKVVYRSK